MLNVESGKLFLWKVRSFIKLEVTEFFLDVEFKGRWSFLDNFLLSIFDVSWEVILELIFDKLGVFRFGLDLSWILDVFGLFRFFVVFLRVFGFFVDFIFVFFGLRFLVDIIRNVGLVVLVFGKVGLREYLHVANKWLRPRVRSISFERGIHFRFDFYKHQLFRYHENKVFK